MTALAAGSATNYAGLSNAGKDSMDRLKDSHDRLLEVVRAVELVQSEVHACVYDAMSAKVPARLVADLLGVSASRVYQIREEVSRHRQRDRLAAASTG